MTAIKQQGLWVGAGVLGGGVSKTGSPKLVEQKRPSQARFLFGTRGMNSVQGARRSSLGGHPGGQSREGHGNSIPGRDHAEEAQCHEVSERDCGWCAFGTGVWNLASRVWGG